MNIETGWPPAGVIPITSVILMNYVSSYLHSY